MQHIANKAHGLYLCRIKDTSDAIYISITTILFLIHKYRECQTFKIIIESGQRNLDEMKAMINARKA